MQNHGVNECALQCAGICLFTWVRHSEMTNVMKEGVHSTGPGVGGTVRRRPSLGAQGAAGSMGTRLYSGFLGKEGARQGEWLSRFRRRWLD